MTSFTRPNTPVEPVTVARWRWLLLIRELDRRGRRRRESGAFLLGRPGSREVIAVAYFDDLDPHCLRGPYIEFDGYGALTELCRLNALKVLADVHTHPSAWTGQSMADLANPMMPRAGHLALIVPDYARGNRFNLHGVGLHYYAGDGQWRSAAGLLKLSWS